MGPGQLFAHDRELRQGRIDDPVLQSGIVAEEEPEKRDEQEQQWEDREKSVVGEQRRQRAAGIVAELLHHPEEQCRERSLLEGVNTPHDLLDRVHPTRHA